MHIEPTSRCILSCPACPRTWFSEKFHRPFPKQDLNVDDLWRFLDCESGQNINTFLLNGNHGDPIYYPDLFKLIDTFRESKNYKISTNGSHQKPEFWQNLGDRLTSNDTIYFSIDGLGHDNHLYRRNSNWESIMAGLDIMLSKSVKVVWKSLIFSYNENEINQIQEFATNKGCKFVVEPSSRFGGSLLQPSEKNVDVSRLYQNRSSKIEPKCLEQEYISADGFYWPCCLITSYYTLHQTPLWKNRDRWSIKHQNLDQARVHLHQWYNTILEDPENALDGCKMNCQPGQTFAWCSA